MSSTEKKANRLIHEKSPYLLQHAYNPVDWYPWGEEAFNKAKEEDKPIFLSVGYSTCHWCHVMEQESFEDETVAAMLNKDYVAIKVDREERPDIDQVYMKVCQAVTGHGGWPLTVVITPDQQPFFVGTYFPKESREGFPGLTRILTVLAQNWRENRQAVTAEIGEISQMANKRVHQSGGKLSQLVLDKAYDILARDYDAVEGGFGLSPKFPMPHQLLYLLRYYAATGKEQALFMVETTLKAMARGGIYDQIGYGFSRYSMDVKWHVPHFEKMLYDNALLAYTYSEAYRATKDVTYQRIAEETFTYLMRDMMSPEGVFYSAEDADSEGVEGKFYLWSKQEISDLLGADADWFLTYYSVTDKGNFADDANILYCSAEEDREFAADHKIAPEEFQEKLAAARRKLWEAREKRIRPHRDDKILLGWNALAIAALAKGARELEKDEYLSAAERAFAWLKENLRRSDGRWLLRYCDGETANLASLDDYAYLCWALLEMYETTYKIEYLVQASEVAEEINRLFADSKRGGYYFTGHDSEALLQRPKEYEDGAIPSGNSVIAWCFSRLLKVTGKGTWRSEMEKTVKSISGAVNRYPRGYAFFLLAILERENCDQAVVAGRRSDSLTQELLAVCREDYHPLLAVILNDAEQPELIREWLPQTESYPMKEDQATAYVCTENGCELPVQTAKELRSTFTAVMKAAEPAAEQTKENKPLQ